MIRSTALWLTLTLLAATSASQAEIYKSVDPDGRVIFTDRPTDTNAEAVALPPVNTQPATRVTLKPLETPPDDETGETEDDAPLNYSLTMTRPAQETTVTMGQMTLAASINLSPSLQDGHRIQFYLDDQPVGKPSRQSHFTYQELYRGIHQLDASVLDPKGKVLASSQSVTIYVHRRSIINAN